MYTWRACAFPTTPARKLAAFIASRAAGLRAIMHALPDSGIWEIVCHPGYNDSDLDTIATRLRASREIEREALLEVFTGNSLNPSPPERIHYGSLGAHGALRESGHLHPRAGHKKIH